MTRLRDGLIGLALLLPTSLHAQAACADRESVVASLTTKYGESFAGGGLQNSEQILEVWFSEEKGTWTVLLTRANGRTCIMASGTNWHDSGDVKVPAGIPG